jgi:anti-anti-sigma factor
MGVQLINNDRTGDSLPSGVMMLLTTQVTHVGGCAVVGVEGELYLTTAPPLHVTLGAVVADGDDPVVLDLAALRFCDSAGLAVFVRAHNQLKEKGRRFVMASAQSAVERVLDLSGIAQVIPLAADTTEALALASKP